MAKFSWLDECSELSLGSELWYFWPLAISRGSQNSISIRYVRKWQTSKSKIGEFYIEGSSIKGFFLEPAGPDTTIRDLDKRIPIGEYSLCWHYGGHYKGVLKLYNEIAPKDRNILIHNGNFPEDSEWCLLCGVKRGKDYVGPSVVKLEEIKSHFNKVGLKMLRLLLQKIIKMIKKNFLILILLLVPLHSYANQNYFSLRDDVSCLKGNFEGAQNKVKESELMFFDCFPKDFRKYAMLFGLEGGGVDNNYGKLYNESYDYVMLYFEISKNIKNIHLYSVLL
ncbi:DUF5675 family protein [Vibrio xiamenensis]|nr:DUF5675 family protein [Vibrio xiamenensis]